MESWKRAFVIFNLTLLEGLPR